MKNCAAVYQHCKFSRPTSFFSMKNLHFFLVSLATTSSSSVHQKAVTFYFLFTRADHWPASGMPRCGTHQGFRIFKLAPPAMRRVGVNDRLPHLFDHRWVDRLNIAIPLARLESNAIRCGPLVQLPLHFMSRFLAKIALFLFAFNFNPCVRNFLIVECSLTLHCFIFV